jgi:hypothetical protein
VEDSPCIDAGHPDSVDVELDCAWGLGTQRSDMGAFGGGGVPSVAVEDDGEEPPLSPLPAAFRLSQNRPNPFNPMTVIGVDIPGSPGALQHVTLTVHDVRGRLVKTLVNSTLHPGHHRFTWDGRNERGGAVASGVYLYTLHHPEGVTTRKMLLTR